MTKRPTTFIERIWLRLVGFSLLMIAKGPTIDRLRVFVSYFGHMWKLGNWVLETSNDTYATKRCNDSVDTIPDEWPHDNWNLDAARFLRLIQSAPSSWLCYHEMKYINLRVDTRDGGFLLMQNDGDATDVSRILAAVKRARVEYGAYDAENAALDKQVAA